jgi:hypothetical protein
LGIIVPMCVSDEAAGHLGFLLDSPFSHAIVPAERGFRVGRQTEKGGRMHRFFVGLLALVAILVGANSASAQGLDYRPIDTGKAIVQPLDSATNIFTGTSRIISRAVAGTIENNGFVRTLNNILGRTAAKAPTQSNGIPNPTSYQSTKYDNSFKPVMPTSMQFGTTPGTVKR